MKIRVQARVLTFDPKRQSILLVRNPKADFWYVPGGGMEADEDIKQCAIREMREETGLHVDLKRLLYVQELDDEKKAMVILELFWLAELSYEQTLNEDHIDTDGDVEEVKWFAKEELKELTVYPERLKDSFWNKITQYYQEEDPFIGTFR